jgi:proteasome component ECM29
LAQATAIWPTLEKALSGKTWDGKEAVVDAFARFVKKAPMLWESQGQQISQIALREAKRTNPTYRKHGISALGEVVETQQDLDLAYKVLTTLSDISVGLVEGGGDLDSAETSLKGEAVRQARYRVPI